MAPGQSGSATIGSPARIEDEAHRQGFLALLANSAVLRYRFTDIHQTAIDQETEGKAGDSFGH